MTVRSAVRWGVGSYSYGWSTGTYGAQIAAPDRRRLSAGELVRRAVAEQVRVVQIAVQPNILLLTGAERSELRSLARSNGVEIETGTTGTDPDHLRRYVEASTDLGARLVRTILRDAGATLERAGNNLSQLLPTLEADGIQVAIENFEGFSADEHATLISGLGSRFVGSCIDTVNNLGRGEGTEEVLNALLPSVLSLHLKDFVSIRSRADSGFEITGTPLGRGRLPVASVVERVLSRNPDASIILEQWIPFQGSVDATVALEAEWAHESLRALRGLLDTGETRQWEPTGG